jgi:hypothetical protein
MPRHWLAGDGTRARREPIRAARHQCFVCNGGRPAILLLPPSCGPDRRHHLDAGLAGKSSRRKIPEIGRARHSAHGAARQIRNLASPSPFFGIRSETLGVGRKRTVACGPEKGDLPSRPSSKAIPWIDARRGAVLEQLGDISGTGAASQLDLRIIKMKRAPPRI